VERTSAADTSSSEARAVPMMRRTKK